MIIRTLEIQQFAEAGSRVRYGVLALAVLLAGITYLDRVCIALTAPFMMRDLNLSKVQMSLVFSAFIVFGAVGFVWAAVWYWWFRDDPEQHRSHRSVSTHELAHIQHGRG